MTCRRSWFGVAAGASVIVACWLIAAHFLRSTEHGLFALFAVAPLLLLWRKRWVPSVLQLLLMAGAAEWFLTASALGAERRGLGEEWTTVVAVLTGVAAFTLLAAAGLSHGRVAGRFQTGSGTRVSAATFALAGAILVPVQLVVDPPGLLLERFWATGGWLEIGLLGLYAAWLTDHVIGPRHAVWRRRLWTFFSAAFFAQLLIGLAGAERFLMTGELHLPVPALIVAGPLFRGEGLFMPILFGATVLVVGPAWCSHLCYVGAWDGEAARSHPRPRRLPHWRRGMQVGILFGTVAAAAALGAAGVPGRIAVWPAAAFGVIGVALMLTWSRRTAVMSHCVAYCPIGVLSTWLGRLNPFRLRIAFECDACGACSGACRYDALRSEDLARGRPGSSCTLCGDCVSRCRDGHLTLRFPGLRPAASRGLFVVLVVALHAAFLGVARI